MSAHSCLSSLMIYILEHEACFVIHLERDTSIHLREEMNRYDFHPTMEGQINSGSDDGLICHGIL
jgi:hypothetical protein